ncbi:MAG: lipopolysaccharide transport periplasmic protein LptA [Mariprofundaceae bacterium]
MILLTPTQVKLILLLLFPLAALAADEAPPQTMQIEADQLEVEHNAGKATFIGHVRLVRGAFVLSADRLTAFYGEEDGRMRFSHGRAEGNVHFEEGDRQGAADEVVFDQGGGKITLLGHAELEQPGGQLSGDSIEYDLNSGDTRVHEGKSGRVKLRIEQGLSPSLGAPQTP